MTSTLAATPGCNPACRACHYKDLEYPAQLERKQRWAETQLGSWKDALREIIAAPESERLAYRSKSWMKCSIEGGEISFGMFRSVRVDREWTEEFVSWNECPIHSEAIREMVKRLRGVKELGSLVGVWFGSPHLVLVSRDPDRSMLEQIDWARILVPPFDRVWFHCNPQVGRKIFGHKEIALLSGVADPSMHPIRAFRQAAQTLLVQARALAVDALLREKPSMVLDLYCGTGEIATLLPDGMGWVGIEQTRQAAEFASAFVGAVEQRLADPKVLERIREPYALYINPPRSGMSEEAGLRLSELIQAKPPLAISYLSCSASSLARDLRLLESLGFRIELLQPFDFFPQTEHFETLAILIKKSTKARNSQESCVPSRGA